MSRQPVDIIIWQPVQSALGKLPRYGSSKLFLSMSFNVPYRPVVTLQLCLEPGVRPRKLACADITLNPALELSSSAAYCANVRSKSSEKRLSPIMEKCEWWQYL